jgi:ribonucleoside-triphosphate reductase
MITNITKIRDFEDHLQVLKTGYYEKFDHEKIKKSLMVETSISEKNADLIVNEVIDRLYRSNTNIVTPRSIREMAISILVELGMEDEYTKYKTIGIASHDIGSMIKDGYKENANVYHSPRAIHGWLSSRLLKKHALEMTLPKKVARAHKERILHVHDLNMYDLVMFCQAWDPRIVLKFGLPPTKNLSSYKYSRPCKSMRTTCIHLANWFSYAQGVFSGGQGYMGFNTVLAPYVTGLSDREVKKALESFVFQVNQTKDSMASQVPFTSIDMTMGIDERYADLKAIKDGEFLPDTYSEYEEESLKIIETLCDIYKSGDARGIPFSFSKFEIKVDTRSMKKYPETWDKILELTAKNGTPYFLNGEILSKSAHSQCCRIIFDTDGKSKHYCVDPDKFILTDEHFPSFGSQQAISLNLPRLAIDAKFDEDLAEDLMYDRLDLIMEGFKKKDDITLGHKSTGFPPLYWKKVGDSTLVDLDLQSFTTGFVGLNEMVVNLIGDDLSTKHGHEYGLKWLERLSKWTNVASIDNQMMVNLWEQPAESTAGDFALYDWKNFNKKGIAVQGNGRVKNGYYYTNSSHVPYNSDIPLYQKLLYQGDYHPIVKGGVISHIWLGESWINKEGLSSLIEKILTKTTNYYFAFTKDYTECLGNDCGRKTDGVAKSCIHCGSTNVDWVSRITGYYASMGRANAAKKAEWLDRVKHNPFGNSDRSFDVDKGL